MNPVIVLVPVAALLIAPRLWVNYVLKKHNRKDQALAGTASELAREMLDLYQLQYVKVEITDIGDHYDMEAKAVRLARDKFDRKTLTAVTTAAHEVSHALQDAAGYAPFIWRRQLVKAAQVTGQVGTVVLLVAPTVALISRNPLPTAIIGAAIYAMLVSGLAAQLVTLPTELDASFNRALPILQNGYIDQQQIHDARQILVACSLTYMASSLLTVLNIWPWLGRGRAFSTNLITKDISGLAVPKIARQRQFTYKRTHRVPYQKPKSITESLVRQIGKPMIRAWYRFSRDNKR